MNKNKKYFSVLSSAALGVLIASAVSSTASAKVTDYVAKDASGRTISFNLDALLKDYENKFSTGTSPMFDEYMKDAANLVAFKDDKTGLVSAQSVLSAYTDAVIKDGGKTFKLDTVTEAATAADLAKDVTIGYQCNADGTVTSVDLSKVVKSVSAITASTGVGAVPTLPTTVNVTLGDGTTKAANITWSAAATSAATYATAGTVTVTGTLADYNNYAVSATVTVNGTFAIQSVSAPNAKQVQVVFNQPVDSTTATDVTNYSFRVAGQTSATALTKNTAAATDATATLGSDGKTVTITLTNDLATSATNVISSKLANGDTFQAIVGTGVKTAIGTNLAAAVTNTVTYNDTTAPTLVSATSTAKTSTNAIKLTFSEPVVYSSASVTINGVAASLSAGTNANEVIATSGTSLTPGTTYNLSLLNFKDAAGNLMATNPLATTVTVTADATAPTVTNVQILRDNLVEVTFDKTMNPATLTSGTVKFLDSNLNSAGTATPSVKANTTDNKTFDIAITGVTFNTAGTYTGLLSFTDSVKDATGNAIVPVTKSVTLTKDTAAPTVVGSQYKALDSYAGITNTGKGFIVVKFNEKVNTSAANTAYKVLNDLGASVEATPISAVAVNSNDPTELVLSLNTAVVSTVKSYTVILPTSAVVDLSSQANPSASANLTVDVSSGVPSVSDTTAPVLNTATETAAASATSGTTIALSFTESGSGLDNSTVTDVNNYRLDGAPLPSGSYIQVNTATTATIYIPAGTITKSKNYSLNVSGIKDKAGNVMTPFVDSAITLVDDVKPVLTSGVINTNGTVSLGFSEDMATAVGAEAGLQVKINGSNALAGSNLAYSLADGVGSDAGKYVLSVKKSKQTLAMTAGTLTVNGATYTSSIPTDGITFSFIDVDGSNTYTTGDILLGTTDTNAACATPDATLTADGTYDLNNASALTITSTGTNITDASAITNLLKAGTTITVK